MKLREYLCMGKRVICTDLCELANHEEYTYQTSMSIREFCAMLVEVLKGKSDGRELRGQKYIRENYSWDILSLKFGKLLEKFVASL